MRTVRPYRKDRLAYRYRTRARTAAPQFGMSRESVRKMLRFSMPRRYRFTAPSRRPRLDRSAEFIERSLSRYRTWSRKQRHNGHASTKSAGHLSCDSATNGETLYPHSGP